jgi:hypothetical protein
MNYTVIFIPRVERILTEMYLQTAPNSAARRKFSESANLLDQLLRTDPLKAGSELDGRFLLFQEPFGIIYSVYPDDCLVKVKMIWRHG